MVLILSYIHLLILRILIASCTDFNFSLLRSKIRELHPVHKASLEALLRHLFLIASHSNTNAMTVDALTDRFCYAVLLGNEVMEDGVHLKVRCNNLLEKISTHSLKEIGHGGSHPKRARPV